MAATQSVAFGPIGDKLVGMIGSARDAFNRHSRTGLEQFHHLQAAAAREIDAALQNLAGRPVQAKPGDAAKLNVSRNLMTGLQQILTALGGLREPIQKKVQGNVLFSEKAVAQTNGLFDCQTGLLRSVFDIIQTDNTYLKKFVLIESERFLRECADFATEHETRLIEGLCTPQAAPIFLAILGQFRTLAQHEMELIRQL